MKKNNILLFLLCLLFGIIDCKSQNKKVITSLTPLPLNEIKVDGWIKKQIDRDITSGYLSVYDELQPSMKKNTFGPIKAKNYSIDKHGNWETRRETWWPGEHEGYFAELVVRSAYLANNEAWLKKAKGIIDHVVENQDESGYIGIYDEECRLDNILNENGELHTQARMMSAILAYYEYSKDDKYFQAAKRAVDYVIHRYVTSGKTYFQQPKPNGGGLTHGLTYVEILEWMHRLTKDKKYVDFAEWLYLDYSAAEDKLRNVDCQLKYLLDRNRLFLEHSVHVGEHLRVVFWLAEVTNKPEYKQAAENALYKYRCSQSPTGALVMDSKIHESVAGNFGSSWLPYEYCTITEGLISLSSAMAKFNRADLGDVVESIAFNAAQAARLPDGKAISYATIENRYDALASNNERYQIAACHKTACCNLEAGKLMPNYVGNMWMKHADNNGIALSLYGESTVETILNNTGVKIVENTAYPFDNKVLLTVEPTKEVIFTLTLRNPSWSPNTKVVVEDAIVKEENGWFIIEKKWKPGDKVEIAFSNHVQVKRFPTNEIYFQKGCLLYAVPLEENRIIAKDHGNGFVNYDVVPKDKKQADELFTKILVPANIDNPWRANKNKGYYKFIQNPAFDPAYPFDNPYGFINMKFVNDSKEQEMQLVPIGSTILRKLTFKEDKH